MRSKPLWKIATNISSGLTPLRANSEFWDEGTTPWLKTEQLGEKYIFETNEYISKAALDKTSIKIFPVNTLSIAMYGEGKTRGNVSILKKPMTTNQACCNIVIDASKADFEYVYYYLKTQYEELRNLSSGVRKNLNTNDIKNYPIRLPESLNSQKKVVSLLKALDDKIELNNRVNAELEAMAKTLYDYWFVQFDFPDANGKPYKTSGGNMVYNSTLNREIPEMWEVKKLSKLIAIGSGFPFDSTTYQESGTYKVITIKNVQSEGLSTDKTDFIECIPKGLQEYCILGIGDVLMSLTGNVGRVCLVNEENLLLNQRVGKFLCAKSWRIYFYLYFTRAESRLRLEKIATGSSQKNLSPIDAVNFWHTIPNKEVISRFNEVTENMMNLIIKKSSENKRLAGIRDWLLPMLMNGQVTVTSSSQHGSRQGE